MALRLSRRTGPRAFFRLVREHRASADCPIPCLHPSSHSIDPSSSVTGSSRVASHDGVGSSASERVVNILQCRWRVLLLRSRPVPNPETLQPATFLLNSPSPISPSPPNALPTAPASGSSPLAPPWGPLTAFPREFSGIVFRVGVNPVTENRSERRALIWAR